MKETKENTEQTTEETRKVWFYVAIGLIVGAVVAFGLTFSVLKIYALISSILLSLGALAFLRTQKKRNNFKAVLPVTVCAYVALAAGLLLFIGGLIYSAL